jgi:SSS family solute:Na+ symporter
MVNFYGAISAVVLAWLVMVVVTTFTPPKPESELRGLVYGLPDPSGPDVEAAERTHTWWESPRVLGYGALVITAILSIIYL